MITGNKQKRDCQPKIDKMPSLLLSWRCFHIAEFLSATNTMVDALEPSGRARIMHYGVGSTHSPANIFKMKSPTILWRYLVSSTFNLLKRTNRTSSLSCSYEFMNSKSILHRWNLWSWIKYKYEYDQRVKSDIRNISACCRTGSYRFARQNAHQALLTAML
jgi:hypothetical protein